MIWGTIHWVIPVLNQPAFREDFSPNFSPLDPCNGMISHGKVLVNFPIETLGFFNGQKTMNNEVFLAGEMGLNTVYISIYNNNLICIICTNIL